jgi:hypothetical protein
MYDNTEFLKFVNLVEGMMNPNGRHADIPIPVANGERTDLKIKLWAGTVGVGLTEDDEIVDIERSEFEAWVEYFGDTGQAMEYVYGKEW